LQALTALNTLHLSENLISKIENLEALTALNALYLIRNQISEIENLKHLTALKELYLEDNPISNYPGKIPTDFNVIKAYFADQQKIDNNSVKVNILGEGRIGKTQLFNYLTKKKYQEGADPTHGTNKDFYKRITNYKVSLWDFGGQSYHHGFHELFIGKDDINIVLWIDNAKNKDAYSYWLGTAREPEILEKDDKYKNPLLLVQNIWAHTRDDDHYNESAYPSSEKIDKYQLSIEEVHLINVQELFHRNQSWSSKHANFIETLNEKIRLHASKQVALRERWVEIKNMIDENPLNQIAVKVDEFREKYASELDDDYFLGLLYYLEFTGNIIRLTDSDELKDYIFADPPFLSDWLFNTVLDKKFQESNNPEIDREILNTKCVSKRDCDIFFNLMTYFGLIFKKPNFGKKANDQVDKDIDNEKQIYIVPQFLPDFNHSFKSTILELLPFNFSLKFPDYFHESKIFNFFARYGEYAEDETSYWKYGLLYKHHLQNSSFLKTLVYFNRDERQIFFHIENKKGMSEVAQELFKYFADNKSAKKVDKTPQFLMKKGEITKIFGNDFFEYNYDISSEIKKDDIHLITQSPFEFDVLETIQNIKANNYFGRCTETNKRMKLDYMAINLLDTTHKKKNRIFFSYSHKDEKYRDELEIHMAMLKRSGAIETWHDRKILAGENWDEMIKEQLMQADIVLLMLSPEFLNSDYIWEQELGLLKQRKTDEHDNVTIIPIFTRPCDTTGLEWMELEGLQIDSQSNLPWLSSNLDRDNEYVKMIQKLRQIL
ncbi:MAG: TIR domain-containing protein, partial [Saprospiraceae bacterium]